MNQPNTQYLSQSLTASVTLPLERISRSKFQPRSYFDEAAMEELTASVKQHGILQPIIVRPIGENRYELVAGERRYQAAKRAKLPEAPAVVQELNDTEALKIALLENLQRDDLNAIEETEGILQLLALNLQCPIAQVPQVLYRLKHLDDNSLLDNSTGSNVLPNPHQPPEKSGQNVLPNVETVENGEIVEALLANPTLLAQQVKAVFDSLNRMNWQSFVKSRLSLLKLPPELLEAVRTQRIEYTKAKAIAKVKPPAKQQELLEKAIAGKWSLKHIKAEVAGMSESQTSTHANASNLSTRLDAVYKQMKKSLKQNQEIWQNSTTQERVETLLTELEGLLNNQQS
ncbi:ParB/RepB/Spo0J family partition protein [Phormidium sp. CCY1219]|uniref:ParB/RepB/Spo0J family partition protein n=1 Tax=Phormidium sp. CCY1219 TaxID=2886104 RepID=UPI002D1F1B29|nr:ParB/RepB/Spo0J family partition protein [Phormidium sp. CCY1219]MEB3827017.1 ParB/RepB/Spo0J family partition protein [Phormidium sp. CCY1219]